MVEERVLISDNLNDFVSFGDDAIQYGMTRIRYAEVEATKFYSASKTVNFIPAWNTYSFAVLSTAGNIQLRLTSRFRIGNQKKSATFNELFRLTEKHIHPCIASRMIFDMFAENETITIGPIRLNRLGMESDTHKGYLPWQQLHSYNIHMGALMIYASDAHDPDKQRFFSGLGVGFANAMVLPIVFQHAKKLVCKKV